MARTKGAVARNYRWARSVAEDYCRPRPPTSDGRREPPTQAGLEALLQAEAAPDTGWEVRQDVPSPETLAKWFRELRPVVGQTPWSLATADVKPETRWVIEVMAMRIREGDPTRSDGHPPMTAERARWIERLAVAAPWLTGHLTMLDIYAGEYEAHEVGGPADPLFDWGLAFMRVKLGGA